MARQSLKVPHFNSKILWPPILPPYRFSLFHSEKPRWVYINPAVCADSDAEYCLGKLKGGLSGSGGEGRTDHRPHTGAVLLKYSCTIS